MEIQIQQTVTINLQDLFVMNTPYFIKYLNERCFNRLNEFLKEKSGATTDPFFVREERHKIKIGYVPRNNKGTKFFSNENLSEGDSAMDKAIMLQFIIFEGCKEYDCFEHVPMCGAPEENKESFFTFTYKDIQYKYLIWKPRS